LLSIGRKLSGIEMNETTKRAAIFCGSALLFGCGGSNETVAPPPDFSRAVTEQRLRNAASEPQNWLTHGGTYLEQRHSPLTEINKDTLRRLAPAWYYEFDTYRGQEATPLVADGVLYTTSAWSKAYALNAATGELIWSYDPKVPGAAGAKACCDVNSRGPALYMDKLIIATLDGRLIALDRATGAPLWSTLTVDPSKMYTITGAPRVVKDKVVIGNAGAEFGVRGYVSAYDADTGELAWRFYVVPGDPAAGPDGAASDKALSEIAAPTWFGRWYEMGGGGTPWDAIVYDAELDQLYVGTGNGSPWNRLIRSDGRGDNLFLASVLALDPDTGDYIWHYQQAPGESWDFTSTQPMILADLSLGGEQRKVIMQAPKNGFFYVLDRRTGKVLSANNFVPTYWATHVDLETGRPAIVPNAYYDLGPFVGSPTGLGAHNWSPMSYNPLTGLVYFRASRASQIYRTDPDFVFREGLHSTGIYRGAPTDEDRALNAANPPLTGSSLVAWDPVAGAPKFEIDGFGGGVLTTAANLLFQGRGTITGELIAFDATTGEQLWSHETPNSMAPGPISYSVGGEQYIAVMAGRGFSGGNDADARARNPGRLFAFKLDGKATLPPAPGPAPPPNPPDEVFPAAVIAAGAEPYRVYCSRCHGGEAHSLNIIPDLRRSAALANAALWKNIVIDGALEANGMIGWSQFLLPEEAETIRAYVAAQARTLHELETGERSIPSAIEPPTIEPIPPPALDPTAL
jgi:quinohemoprotein ethanol dehydrogenase